jgi:esterase
MKLTDYNYHIQGSVGAPWLIFLHGLLGNAGNWRRITPAFEADYRILTYDQRGHGRSFKPESGYAPEDFAADLLYLMNELKIDRANLVGHSMGGRNAFCFGAQHPERIFKLVIEDIGPEASFDSGPGLVDLLRSVPVPFTDKKRAKEYLLGPTFGDPGLGSYFYTSITALADGRATWNFDMKMVEEIVTKGRGAHRWNEIRALKIPTLVIRGEKSGELSHEEFQKMLKANSRISGVEILGAGHWIHTEKPDEFIAAVKDFLKN